MKDNIVRRLTPIFRDILGSDVILTEDLDASKVAEWDSLNHISLIVAIEGEFKVEFTTDELSQMATLKDMIKLLETKGASHGE